jgi:hypothetical protein
MASQPLRRALLKALHRRAEVQLGARATPLEYVEFWLVSGRTFQALAQDIEADLGQPVSRKFVSFVCNRLTADARSRIRAARLEGELASLRGTAATVSDRETASSSCAR